MNDLWFFVEHGKNKTWTRALAPTSISTIRDLMGYLQRGGRVDSPWMDMPDRARFIPRVVGTGVIAKLVEPLENHIESYSQKGSAS